MRPFRSVRFLSVLSALAALSFALSACSSDEAVISNSPPTGLYEIIPAIANPQTEIWRAGYWSLIPDEGFEWVPGQIIPRPTPTAVWAPARWVHHDYGWTFEQGHWQ